jgi:hypothetical protein
VTAVLSNRLWLFVTIPLVLGGVIAIARLALGRVRSARHTVIASLPVIPEQSLLLPRSERYVLLTEGRLGERALGDLRFSVTSEAGRELRIAPVNAASSATSLGGTVRLELFSFSATAGRHAIRTLGMDPERDYRQNRIVIARQGRGQLAVRIVALVVTTILTLGALVASSLLIAGPR